MIASDLQSMVREYTLAYLKTGITTRLMKLKRGMNGNAFCVIRGYPYGTLNLQMNR
jgi:hypothetical protein